MRPKPRFNLLYIPLLLVTVAFGGCTGKDDGGPAEIQPTARPAQYTDDTGGIEGFVTDDQSVALASVEVGILALNLTTQSDVQGRFSLSNVPPGTHDLAASRLGYEPTVVTVEVIAGEATSADIKMVPLAIQEPYGVFRQEAGLFGCGVSWRPAVVFSGVSACGVLSIIGPSAYDRFLIEWELNNTDESWRNNVFEMVWDSNQLLGQALWFIWEVDDCPNVGDVRFASFGGESPLTYYENNTHLREIMDNLEESDCDDASGNCGEKTCRIMSRVFSEPGTLGPTAPADVGITIQQPFEQYFSAFFHEDAPEGFTALPPQ